MPQVNRTVSPLDSFGERLSAAGDDVAAKRQAYEDAVKLRDEIVVEAIDEAGLNYAQVAKLAKLSTARVVQIVAKGG